MLSWPDLIATREQWEQVVYDDECETGIKGPGYCDTSVQSGDSCWPIPHSYQDMVVHGHIP